MTDYVNGGDAPTESAAAPGANYETTPNRMKRKVNEALDQLEAAAARAIGAEKAARLRTKASDTVDRGEDLYFDAMDRVDTQLRDRPYRTLALTLGAGTVLGFLLAGNRRKVIYRAK